MFRSSQFDTIVNAKNKVFFKAEADSNKYNVFVKKPEAPVEKINMDIVNNINLYVRIVLNVKALHEKRIDNIIDLISDSTPAFSFKLKFNKITSSNKYTVELHVDIPYIYTHENMTAVDGIIEVAQAVYANSFIYAHENGNTIEKDDVLFVVKMVAKINTIYNSDLLGGLVAVNHHKRVNGRIPSAIVKMFVPECVSSNEYKSDNTNNEYNLSVVNGYKYNAEPTEIAFSDRATINEFVVDRFIQKDTSVFVPSIHSKTILILKKNRNLPLIRVLNDGLDKVDVKDRHTIGEVVILIKDNAPQLSIIGDYVCDTIRNSNGDNRINSVSESSIKHLSMEIGKYIISKVVKTFFKDTLAEIYAKRKLYKHRGVKFAPENNPTMEIEDQIDDTSV